MVYVRPIPRLNGQRDRACGVMSSTYESLEVLGCFRAGGGPEPSNSECLWGTVAAYFGEGRCT